MAFLAPKKSKVDIVQAAGRAMRRSVATGKEYGYLLLPLFLETEVGEKIDDALERTGFSEAWDVLQAMQEQDAELADIIREMRVERGRTGGFDDSRLREKLEVIGPEVSLETLSRSIAASIVERLGVSWDERFGELLAYKEANGNCLVPSKWPQNQSFANWVVIQRRDRKKLSAERLNRLEKLGFEWDARAALWEQKYWELVRYHEQHGDCRVPQDWVDNPSLGGWVRRQRQDWDALSDDRRNRLLALSFEQDPHAAMWEQRFAELVQYKEEHGDCNVPQEWPSNQKLANWVSVQRGKRDVLPEKNRKRLDRLGFEWSALTSFWERRFSELVDYKEKHGNCNVPSRWKENPQLAGWVARQRSNRDELSAERRDRLNAIGFEWDPRLAVWEQGYAELLQYYEEFGNCRVPENLPEYQRLTSWAKAQRANRNKLSSDQRNRLEAIGFHLEPVKALWEKRYSELMHYREQHGHCKVPAHWTENSQLGRWVARQRHLGRTGALPDEHRQRLEELGFEF